MNTEAVYSLPRSVGEITQATCPPRTATAMCSDASGQFGVVVLAEGEPASRRGAQVLGWRPDKAAILNEAW